MHLEIDKVLLHSVCKWHGLRHHPHVEMQGPRLVIGDVSGVAKCQDTYLAQRPRDDRGLGLTRAFAVDRGREAFWITYNFRFWETDWGLQPGGFGDGWLLPE